MFPLRLTTDYLAEEGPIFIYPFTMSGGKEG